MSGYVASAIAALQAAKADHDIAAGAVNEAVGQYVNIMGFINQVYEGAPGTGALWQLASGTLEELRAQQANVEALGRGLEEAVRLLGGLNEG